MKLHSITIRAISSALNTPFMTHLQHVTRREALIIEITDPDGRIGYGEADPFSSPWYSEETIQTCRHILKDFLIPVLFDHGSFDPEELDQIWRGVRGNRMAKSGLSQAIWDLYGKQQGVYLGKLFGSTKSEVEAGAVIASNDPNHAVEQIEALEQADHYKRYKLKISRRNDLKLLTQIRKQFPRLPLMADANSDYSLEDTDHLRRLDQFHLMMLEQPLAYNDLTDHAIIQKVMKTPICLDESIECYQDAASAIQLKSGQIFTIKMARVGGWSQAVRIHNLCVAHSIPVWCGGMIEFGIAKAHNIALASLDGFSLPGDLFASDHYWRRDIITPDIAVNHGVIHIPNRPGIGFSVDRSALDDLTDHREIYRKKVK
ncbi:o-succinylbenzoate synthase [Sporolactobacillus shoreicorticis]|uniref:o-succinylbenzoate synthase n=1 Tax=Sporolactobacillus shoreicorticis TaxID=1923877 RepID=A0ABW5S9N6_9BACL|nr:o-succinylbenzoate synthase [Sporolactobacillus shoreicorticis]MCO7125728.1 o-succinylbenzoate synthase [Sporolactobacillus shoreicorticis]